MYKDYHELRLRERYLRDFAITLIIHGEELFIGSKLPTNKDKARMHEIIYEI